MRLNYPGDCARCGRTIPRGTDAHYYAATKTVEHFNCPDVATGETPEQIAKRLNFVGPGEETTVEWSKLRYEIPGEQRRTA